VTTKRKPIRRPARRQITPEAILAFKKMQRAISDDVWWKHHSDLVDALGLPPWEWPAFEDPTEQCPYPAGCVAARDWHQRRAARPHAFELYAELLEAASK